MIKCSVFVALLAIFVLALGPIIASLMLYVPRFFPYDTHPSKCGFEDHYFVNVTIPSPKYNNSEEKIELHGWFFQSPLKNPNIDLKSEKFQSLLNQYAKTLNASNAEAFIVVVHGHGSSMAREIGTDKSLLEKVVAPLWTAGYNVLAFDLRNHGLSPWYGPVSFGIYESLDVFSAIDFLIRNNPDHFAESTDGTKPRLGVWGESMGAATVIITASSKYQKYIRAIVADSAYASLDAVIYTWSKDKMPWMPESVVDYVFWCFTVLAPYSMENLQIYKYATEIELPVMITHGTDDLLVPYENSKRLHNAFSNRANDHPLHSYTHNLGHVRAWDNSDYFPILINFFEEYV